MLQWPTTYPHGIPCTEPSPRDHLQAHGRVAALVHLLDARAQRRTWLNARLAEAGSTKNASTHHKQSLIKMSSGGVKNAKLRLDDIMCVFTPAVR